LPIRTAKSSAAKPHAAIGYSSLVTRCSPVSPLKNAAHSSPIAASGRPAGLTIVYRIQNASGRVGWLARW